MGIEPDQQAILYGGRESVVQERTLDHIISDRGAKASNPRSNLESRIEDEVRIGQDEREKRLGGAPDSVPEIYREVLMLGGALESLGQRLATVVAACQPVLDGEALALLTGETSSPRALHPNMHPQTDIGRRLRDYQDKVGELEDKLSTLAHGIAL